MILAKNKYGQVGRMIPGTGMNAQIDPSQMGERRGNVNVSTRSIEDDQIYYSTRAAEARGLNKARRLEAIVQDNAERIRKEENREKVEAFQRLKSFDPMNEKLRQHFANRAMMGETGQVIESLTYQPSVLNPPANFSSSGANPELIPGERMTGGEDWHADWRNQRIVGNPLTRDGEFGPAITDWDRYVQGIDVNQTNVVQIAGGTMLGRYNGGQAPSGKGVQAMRQGSMNGGPMGDWWDDTTSGVGNFFSDVGGGFKEEVVGDLPSVGWDWLKGQILPGTKPPAPGSTVVIPRPVPGVTTTHIAGMPKPVVYALVGLAVVVSASMFYKAFSK